MSKSIQEKDVQRLLAEALTRRGYSIRREVKTPVGYIDLLAYKNGDKSSRTLIEVKEQSGIKGAYGQALAYSTYEPCDHLWVVYFPRKPMSKDPYKPIDASFMQADNVQFKSITEFVSLDCLVNNSLEETISYAMIGGI